MLKVFFKCYSVKPYNQMYYSKKVNLMNIGVCTPFPVYLTKPMLGSFKQFLNSCVLHVSVFRSVCTVLLLVIS